MIRRKKISFKTKLAAAVAQLLDIPYAHRKMMTEDQVLSLVETDHDPIRHESDPENPDIDAHWNLTIRALPSHRAKTRIDKGEIAIARRRRDAEAEHKQRLLREPDKPAEQWRRKRKIPSRPFQKRKRALRSKLTFAKRKRRWYKRSPAKNG